MSDGIVRADEGQALVIVALAMFVLIGAIALTADWGFGLAMRRGMQNEADGAALAAARLLATTYSGSGFGASQEQAWCAGDAAADLASPSHPMAVTEALDVEFSTDGATYTLIARPSDCAAITTTTAFPDTTRFVRARARASYDSIIAALGRQHLEAAASATARIAASPTVRPLRPIPATGPLPYGSPGVGVSGSWAEPNVAIWPIALWYGNWPQATPGASFRMFWSGSGSGTDGNMFVTFSHYSIRDGRHQLVTESDYTGTTNTHHYNFGTSPLVNSAAPTCGGATWDTNGDDVASTAADCDVPNWLNYGFRGSVSTQTDWSEPTWTTFDAQPAPSITMPSARSSCAALPAWLPKASCANPAQPSTRGDWVETVPRSSVDPITIRDRMLSFIDRYGRTDTSGDRYAVVNVLLWDCAQQYAGSSWNVLPNPTSDCSQVSRSDESILERVHVVAVIPIAVYRSGVSANLHLEARWGGVLGDPGVCGTNPVLAGCDLNPLANSAFLVPTL